MPDFRDRKTPGVYVTEVPAFPPSAVGVETAIPAFVGYTAHADVSGRPAYGTPIPVNSIDEFHTYFGGAPKSVFRFDAAPANDYDVLFSDIDGNGGTGGTGGTGQPTPRKLTRTKEIGALYHSLLLFYANGGGRCYVVSVGPYQETIDPAALEKGVQALEEQSGPTMLLVPDLSLLPVVPAAVEPGKPVERFTIPGFQKVAKAMLDQCARQQDRVALLDVVHSGTLTRRSTAIDLGEAILKFRADVDHEARSYGIAYFPYLQSSVVSPTDVDYLCFESGGLQDFVLNEARKLFPATGPESDAVRTAIQAIKADFVTATPTINETVVKTINDLRTANSAAAQKLAFLYRSFYENVPAKTRDQNLTNAFPALKQLYAAAVRVLNRLPASAAMAGVMTFTDTARGVWTAPANLALVGVESTTLSMNDETQGDLNRPLDGKAINVIREFIGRGAVVWGARTLDGNSNDYRYIQVRRTLIYIEQSIKLAMGPLVFAPNDSKTWVSATATIGHFLQDLWAKGGLMGATAREAFSVDCGLGSTMTSRDVLEGYMIVRVLLQIVSRAEFIELTFKQKMERAG